MNQPLIEGDDRIRRRWLIGIALFAATWFLLLWPLANALFGLPGKAPDNDAQANRLIYEELVKLVLVLGRGGAGGLARGEDPGDAHVPAGGHAGAGADERQPGLPGRSFPASACVLAALATLGFRIASLRVTLELAALLRQVG